MKTKFLEIRLFGQINNAVDIEDIICLSVMINNGILPIDATVDHAALIYENLPFGCNDCQFADRCLACLINR